MKQLFTIPFSALVRWHMPRFIFTQFFLDWMQSYLAGVDLIKAELLAYRKDKEWLMKFSGSKIYLEHYLNDLYDPIVRGITIENAPFIKTVYLYNQSENRVQYYYNLYDSEVDYVVGEYCREGDTIYKCIDDSTDNLPSESPAYWEEYGDATFLYNKGEIGSQIHYRVIIPEYMTLSQALKRRITGSVNVFNVATKNFEIKKA